MHGGYSQRLNQLAAGFKRKLRLLVNRTGAGLRLSGASQGRRLLSKAAAKLNPAGSDGHTQESPGAVKDRGFV